jgi:hypothetical protein
MVAGRPKIDLEPHREFITEMFENGASVREIASALSSSSRPAASRIHCRPTHVHKYIRLIWQLKRDGPSERRKSRLLARVQELYFRNWSHAMILRALSHDGFSISTHQLKRMRLEDHLIYANRTSETEEHNEQIRFEIRNRQMNGGVRYGARMMQVSLRQSGLFVGIDQVRHIMREVDIIGVEARKLKLARTRGKYSVAGPGRVFSCDGYDKLKPWGFHIYGFIDGYSRYVPMVYIGIDNKTSISILKLYIEMVKGLKKLPELLRSDKGVETNLMAYAQVTLRRELADDPELEFRKMYSFGTSVRNIRIESWWARMADMSLNEWREYFQELTKEGNWGNNAVDRTALRYATYSTRFSISISIYITLY